MNTTNGTDYTNLLQEIFHIIEEEYLFLKNLSEDVVSDYYNSQGRNIKMLVGHMIDSASNNHQRMVRLQYAPRVGYSIPNGDCGMLVFPDYTQDNNLWLELQDYKTEGYIMLVELWKYYNLHIIHVIKSVNKSKLRNYWIDYDGNKVTLNDMICGYIEHLRLHVGQIHNIHSSVV